MTGRLHHLILDAVDDRTSGLAFQLAPDPAGHPFWLIPRPDWAPPVGA